MKRLAIVCTVLVLMVTFFVYNDRQRIVRLEASVSQQDIQSNILIWLKEENSMTRQISTLGSGVIIARDNQTYYALSAYHVVSEASDTKSYYYMDLAYNNYNLLIEYRDFEAKAALIEIVSYDESKDLVLLRFESPEDLPVVPLAKAVGKRNNPVLVISNPEGEYDVVSVGRIKSNRLQEVVYEDGSVQENLMNHSAEIAPGSSGSGVLNVDHELIGINVASNIFSLKISGKKINVNGYFVPVDQVRAFLDTTELKNRLD